jgi:hypothetical protein
MFLGRQGDGATLQAWRDAQGRIHCTYKAMRFSGDVSQPVYAVWEGRPPLHRYPGVTPQPLADGTPVLIKNGIVNRWGDGEWQPDPAIPKIPLGKYEVSPDGTSYSFHLNSKTHEFYVARLDEDRWRIGKISLQDLACPSDPTSCLPMMNADGRPVVVIGRYHQPNSWIGVLTKKGT